MNFPCPLHDSPAVQLEEILGRRSSPVGIIQHKQRESLPHVAIEHPNLLRKLKETGFSLSSVRRLDELLLSLLEAYIVLVLGT